MSTTKFEKLPTSVKPILYHIELIPNPHTFQFDGHESIECEVVEQVSTIKLNVAEMQVFEATCNSQKAQVSIDEANEIATFQFASPIPVGKATLHIKFQGNHTDSMKGFYRSSYTSPSGEKTWNLNTQFEASDARKAFPCFDEPDRKAQFRISLIVPENKVALSNMPEVERKPVERPANFPLEPKVDYVRVTFDTTPVMSTYILAMVVGDFECIEDKDENGIKIRVFAPPGKKQCCDYPMDIAKKALPFYTKCFGVEYPLPKLDLIAIPDFSSGAMENWGLVTFREADLMIDSKESSLARRRRVALVVAHELAHMWFGNLVTMKWWTHLWLNEGFATWMEYHCISHVAPEFDIWTNFTTDELSSAFALDGLRSSHPIEVEVGPPSEVDEIFDSISYAKGASIINMLYSWIGHDAFFRGLQAYIEKHKYSNTQTEDLWAAFGEASGQNVCQVMSEWTQKMGYPVVKIVEENGTLKFCQKRFLADGSQDTENYSWPIPLKLAYSNDQEKTHFIDPKQVSTNSVQLPCLDGLLVNPGRLSFVRVHYSGQLLEGVKKMIENGKLGPRDRLAIIDDQISLAFAGHRPISELIDLLSAYVGESHHIVWDSLYQGLTHIQLLLDEAKTDYDFESRQVDLALENFHKLYRKMAEPVLKNITWDAIPGEDGNDTLLRPMIINILGKTNCKPVIEEARKRFLAHVEGEEKNQIVPDLRRSIYAICMRHGDVTVFDALLKLYEKSTMADEKMKLLLCLGLPRDAELRKRAIAFNMSDAVRKQDRYATFTGFYSASPESRRDLWNFVKENINSLPDELGSQSLLGHVCNVSCSGFAHPNREKEVQAFWDGNPVKCKMTIKQSIEEIKINASQIDRDGQNLIAKLCSIAL